MLLIINIQLRLLPVTIHTFWHKLSKTLASGVYIVTLYNTVYVCILFSRS